MTKKNNWYWGCEKPTPEKFILVDTILENFNNKKYKKKYNYLKKNISLLSSEIINIRNFFEKINSILIITKDRNDKLRKIMNLRNKNMVKFIDKHVAEIIIDNFEFNYNKQNKQNKKLTGGGLKSNKLLQVKKNLKLNYRELNHFIKNLDNNSQFGGVSDSGPIIEDKYDRFLEMNKQYENPKLEKKIHNLISLNELPKIFKEFSKHEYNIPLNLNDILLIGFSLLPNIGWIFEIFMIFRALIEKRYIYAILMTINCYQYLFNKLISFGLLGIDFGPVIKLFYVAPYANKNFNLQNIKLKLDTFLETININFNKELVVS